MSTFCWRFCKSFRHTGLLDGPIWINSFNWPVIRHEFIVLTFFCFCFAPHRSNGVWSWCELFPTTRRKGWCPVCRGRSARTPRRDMWESITLTTSWKMVWCPDRMLVLDKTVVSCLTEKASADCFVTGYARWRESVRGGVSHRVNMKFLKILLHFLKSWALVKTLREKCMGGAWIKCISTLQI